jgi:hypothetical protein
LSYRVNHFIHAMKVILHILFSLLLLPALYLETASGEDWVYRLHKGENLTLVAERFLKPEFTPEQLQVYNGVLKDREMPVGTEVRVPMDWLNLSLIGVRVRYVVGGAKLYRRGHDEPEPLTRSMVLAVGDRVVTAEKSAISLEFADGSYLLLGAESEVIFDTLSTYQGQGMLDTRVRLQRGRLENRVKPLKSPDARYEIHAPAAVTVVRGTQFRIGVDPNGVSRSEVTEGQVDVRAAGMTVAVRTGQGTRVEPGRPPAQPRALLPAPDLTQVENRRDGVPGSLSWSSLTDALAYRVQLMNPEETPLLSQRVEKPFIELPGLEPGVYQLRVRGIDDLGLEGLSARRDFEVEAESTHAPPAIGRPLLSPPLFWGGWIEVKWQPVEGAWVHRLMLARDPGFNHLLLDQLSSGSSYRLRLPSAGQYYLAVDALLDATGGERSQIYRIEVPWRP